MGIVDNFVDNPLDCIVDKVCPHFLPTLHPFFPLFIHSKNLVFTTI